MQNNMDYSKEIYPTNSQTHQMGDIIENLPVDESVLSHNEIRIVDQLFQRKKGIFDKIMSNIKDILIIGTLFIFFSINFIDNIIKKFIPSSVNSQYILIGAKAFLFMVTYFVVKNIYLIQKK